MPHKTLGVPLDCRIYIPGNMHQRCPLALAWDAGLCLCAGCRSDNYARQSDHDLDALNPNLPI